MMMNRINNYQKPFLQAISPVHLFENKNREQTQKSSFDFIDKMSQNGYNPFHPNVKSDTMAKRLDILS